jgi:hypothetical protein
MTHMGAVPPVVASPRPVPLLTPSPDELMEAGKRLRDIVPGPQHRRPA